MRFILAFFLPPFALLACKKPGQFVINLILWLISLPLLFFGVGIFIWFICTIHALIICRLQMANRQFDRLVTAIENRQSPAQAAVSQNQSGITVSK